MPERNDWPMRSYYISDRWCLFISWYMSVYLCVCTAALKLPCVIQKRGRTGEKKKKKIWRPRRTSGRCACVRYGIMGCQVSKGRMYLYKIRWIFGQKSTYRTSSYSFRGNYSFFNLEIVANSNSFLISNFYLMNWIFAAESIQGRKLFKGGHYMRKFGTQKKLQYFEKKHSTELSDSF